LALAAEFRCQSAAERKNSAAGELGQIVPKPLIYMGFSVLGGRILAAGRRFSPPAGEFPRKRIGWC
jgi:hypothetical protein